MPMTARYFSGALVVATIVVGIVTAVVISTYGINSTAVTRPVTSVPFAGDPARLLAVGTTRHGDTSLSPIGRSCNTCHLEEDSYNATFNKPYPHFVQSVRLKTGLDRITAEGMVQFCMVSALEAKPLAWDSETLAALTAIVLDRHKRALGRSAAGDSMSGASCDPPPR